MRNHGFGLRVGLGTDIMKFTAGRGWGSALDKPFSLQYCFVCQQRSLIHELAADEIKFASTVRHASTKHFGLWKSFSDFLETLLFHSRRKNSVK